MLGDAGKRAKCMSEPLELGIQPQVKLTIALDPSTGQVNVNGPIGDRLLCFGLLEMAKEAIPRNGYHFDWLKIDDLVSQPATIGEWKTYFSESDPIIAEALRHYSHGGVVRHDLR